MSKIALVVLSGGQDSTTALFWAKSLFDKVHAVTFQYGQRHIREIEAAKKVAGMAGVASHEIIELGPILKGMSPLTDPSQPLETYPDYDQMSKVIGDRVELTFVPMRNALFFTVAANRAAILGADCLVTGLCEADNANYPDCRQTFVSMQELTVKHALGYDKSGKDFYIYVPLIRKTKSQSVHFAKTLPGCMEALAYTHTAYSGEYPPVTQDHATVLRAQGFLEAMEPDPLIVRAWREGLCELPDTQNYDGLAHKAILANFDS